MSVQSIATTLCPKHLTRVLVALECCHFCLRFHSLTLIDWFPGFTLLKAEVKLFLGKYGTGDKTPPVHDLGIVWR
jgi:hypothetical protein